MIQATIAGYIVSLAERIPDDYGSHAALIETFAPEHTDSSSFYLAVSRGFDWPFLCVAQWYRPDHWAGSHPGIVVVPETHLLFIGAGERLLAYDLKGPGRLWIDRADTGFHRWMRHDDIIVMSAELDLSAWDMHGSKLWSAYVEPPWEYHVEGDMVHLDVMGIATSFPLLTGPATS